MFTIPFVPSLLLFLAPPATFYQGGDTSPAHRSEIAFQLPERDLVPEGIAYDPKSDTFFLGSIRKRKILRIDRAGEVVTFVPPNENGLLGVVGVKVDEERRLLWACAFDGPQNEEHDPEEPQLTGVFVFHLDDGRPVAKYTVEKKSDWHMCNDLALASDGMAYVTSFAGGTIYEIDPEAGEMTEFLPLPRTATNGIAITPDDRFLFIAAGRRILRCDRETLEVIALARPAGVEIGGGDGIYFHEGSLLMIEVRLVAGALSDRVLQLGLSGELDAIETVAVLDEDHPLYSTPTTGALVGDWFYYVANSQFRKIDEQGKMPPLEELSDITILKVPLDGDLRLETSEPVRFESGSSTGLKGPYLGQEPPGPEPVVFAPGIVSTRGNFEFSCCFSPDGRELYFNRSAHVYVSRLEEEGWTAPEPAPFNTRFLDHEVHITADGQRAFFGSKRPHDGLTGEEAYGIWLMEREGTGWSEPWFEMPGMYVTTARNGNLYVTDMESEESGIVCCELSEDGYGFPEPLGGGVNTPAPGWHPCIAADESFIVFDSERAGGQGGEGDFYVCFRAEDGSWGPAINLGEEINTEGGNMCASLSPDGKYLFYHSRNDIWWVSAEVIERLRPE